MPILALTKNYLVWHYSIAYVDLLHIWWNYLWFVNHIFSFPEVVSSLFSPFKRLQEDKVSILKSPEDFFANLTVNIIMRIVGFFIRSALIIMALVGFAFVLLVGIAVFLFWTVLPILVGHFFIIGFQSFFL